MNKVDQSILATLAIIKNHKNEILLLDRKYKPFGYGLVGGKIDSSDLSYKDACIREVYEEIGIELKSSELLFHKIDYSEHKNVTIYIFMCTRIINENEIKISEEHNSFIFSSKPEELNLAGNTKNFLK